MGRPRRRLLAVATSAALLVGVGSLTGPACEGHNCDPSNQIWSGSAQVGEGIWQTTPIDAPWLDFRGMGTVTFLFDTSCFPINWQPYLSPDLRPNMTAGGSNWTPAGGNVAEISNAGFGTFSITNVSCAEYYLRVTFECGSPDGGVVSGPADAAHD